ncbi:hypothetical protein F383_01515 [Gossypium arboreum]|uniref:Uncharacterized protein n=1 Tax=Gossypium arboreum TaxID=29729 RepID=A0A0B0P4V5_GOSAR|nr:hypothetical protein F383_01515 [Gossypium arboreum]
MEVLGNDQPLEWLNMIIYGPMYDKTLVGPWIP